MEDNDHYYIFIDMLKSHTVNGEMKEAPSGISFAKEENWEQLFSIIDNAELYNDNEHVPHKQGDDNQTPDLLIIDHFAPFTLDTNANKNQSNFDLLMKKLLARYPGMAILVLHQENKAGDIRGDKSTFNNANPIILITRLSGDEVENEGLRQGQREVFKFEIAKQGRHQEDIREFWPRFVSTTKEGMYYCVFKGFTSKDGLVKVDESLRERIINDNATHAYEQMKRFDGKLTKEEIASILNRGEKTLNKDMGLK